ncbi:MAG: exodeoxyribonuclease V subunit alpha [Thermodesulfobacteriota bacterium]
MKNFITNLNKIKIFNEIDLHFAEFISKLDGNDDEVIFLSAALTSSMAGSGDTCLDLNRYAQKGLSEDMDPRGAIACPALSVWREKLTASTVVGSPGEFKPLVLDAQNRLYLYRYWDYQKKLADAIRQKAANKISGVNLTVLRDGLRRFFKPSSLPVDWQQIAAVAAVLNRFCVIAGGPGTGKTHLVATILVLLLEQDGGSGLRILLTAPTGKAAMKLSAAIKTAMETIPCSDAVREALPTEAATIHRLLKTVPHSPYFHYCEDNPLPADVVVVDEASMIDLALMSKLFQALPSATRVILAGDSDQLASVEPGSVLGDVCDQNRFTDFSDSFCATFSSLADVSLQAPDMRVLATEGLHDSIIRLQKNYRFSETGGIGGFSRAVRSGNAGEAVDFLDRMDESGIVWEDCSSTERLSEILTRYVLEEYSPSLRETDPSAALEKFNRFQVLCALNRGPFGVHAVNDLIEQVLIRNGLVAPARRPQSHWYRGRPVIVTRNDYRLSLYNGDVGITLPDPKGDDSALYVFFQDSQGETRRFNPARLPEHETVYAMTVHKSQGSEFAKILLVLPDKDAGVLTRELIYTAVTRAREQVVVCGNKPILQSAISRGIDRTSGLRDALWY